MNFITNQGWETLSKYKGWLKFEEKPNKSSKIAILIKDDTRTCTKYSDNVHLKGVKHTLQKSPFAWLHIYPINLQPDSLNEGPIEGKTQAAI